MSQNNFRLCLDQADTLAVKITADLRPVCERIEIVGSVRRRCRDVGEIEILAIPKFSASLLPGVPGVSLLDMHLVALLGQGRLMWASLTPLHELSVKPFYVPALLREGHFFKLEIFVSDADRWPVELAIRTGPAEFSHRLVCHSNHADRGFLPYGWQMRDGWQVWNDKGERVKFESEREFIEMFCGQWIEPEKR